MSTHPGLDFEYGLLRLRFQFADVELACQASRLRPLLKLFSTDGSSSDRYGRLLVKRAGSALQITEPGNPHPGWSCRQATTLGPYLEWLVHQLAGDRLTEAVGLHAAAVGPSTAPILLVGQSGVGKSTLALHLVRQGWRYWSDDLAVIELDHGLCLPYPKPIKLDGGRSRSRRVFRHACLYFRVGRRSYRYVLPWRIPGHRLGEPAAPAAVLILGRAAGAIPTFHRSSPTELLRELIVHAGLRKDYLPQEFEALCRLIERTPGGRLLIGSCLRQNVRAIRQITEQLIGRTA